MTLPRIRDHLPDLMHFVQQLADDCEQKRITTWQAFITPVLAFYTPAMMHEMDRVTLNWSHMASFAEQQTLVHVTAVLTALLMLPEYREASENDQRTMEWMVLFHDVAKEPQPRSGVRDYIHGFRSAAVAGKALCRLGFPFVSASETELDQWVEFTHGAVKQNSDHQTIQDNAKLPTILSGIAQFYGANTPAEWIIKGVLLHLSLVVDPTYPTLAPLTEEEIKTYIDPQFYPFMKVMTLVDNDGWNLFDDLTKQRYRQQALSVFDQLHSVITQP